jgi:hypothetical protein
MTFLCTTVAHAQQPPAFLGAPPAFKTVASTNKEKGQITFLETVVRMVPEQRARVVIRDGKQITENVTVQRPVFEQTLRLFDATKSRVITPDGKQLPIDEVWKRLKANTVVVVSADGNTPAQVYLRALSADTLVIIPGPAAPMAVPAPMPIPVPKKF